ncbi:ABC transporter permease [Saccharomonospora iraqiensis]|uniref:ABC transporter permease n=1 Tax=Saccharomonospora iraqiensis TaxID=52698 RepID=UPI00022E2023|nr:ABC transporter permease [Saccharomonospora iraqiensis]
MTVPEERRPSRGDGWIRHARVFGVEVADEVRGIVREPTALFFSILMPVGFFVLFVAVWGDLPSGNGPTGTRMLATFGTFGVLAVTLLNPGIGVAEDRERGWLRAKRVSAVPVPLTLTAKVAAAVPCAFGVFAAMVVTAGLTGTLDASPAELLRIGAVLLLGSLPFALLGMAVGFRARGNTTAAILNAVLLPSAVLSGLWMPLEILPDFMADIAVFLPTYHLARLALAQLGGVATATHLVALFGTTAVAAVLAAVSYRRART